MKNRKYKIIFITACIVFFLCVILAFYYQQKYLTDQLVAGLGSQEHIESIFFQGASPQQIKAGFDYLRQQGYGESGYLYLNRTLIYRLPLLILAIASVLFVLTVWLLQRAYRKQLQADLEVLIQIVRHEDAMENALCSEDFCRLKAAVEAMKKEKMKQQSEYQRMNQLQLNYLENITHQIKTPLTSLLLLIDMCRNATADVLNENLNEAEEICHQLDEITSLLLKAGKLRSNQNNLNYAKLHINELLTNCVNQTMIKYPQIRISFTAESDFYLWGDQTWLKEAFINILDNCSRYSPVHALVTVSAYQISDKLYIKIKDEGHGIDEAEIDMIFNRYHQSKQAHEESHFGIGLHLAKDIINAHCGQIDVHNEKPSGTCFTISFALLQGEMAYNHKS